MANTFVQSWAKKGLYYKPEATWGTAVTGTGFYRIPLLNTPAIYAAEPIMSPGPMGSGQPVKDDAYYDLKGRRAAAFETQHPVTSIVWRDMWSMFFKSHQYTATDDFVSPYSAAGAVVWTSLKDPFATVVLANDSSANATSYEVGTSCVIKTLSVEIPEHEPGAAPEPLKLTCGWIGQQGTRASSYTITTPTEDTAAMYDTGDVVFAVGGTTASLLSCKIDFDNGARLDSSAAALAQDVIYGEVTGKLSLSCYFAQGAIGAGWPHAVDAFMTGLEGPTYQALTWVIGGASVDMGMTLPVKLTGTPTKSESNGIVTLSFEGEVVYVSTTVFPKVTIPESNAWE